MSTIPILHTDRLILRPHTEADAPAIQPLLSVPGISTHTLSFPYPFPEGGALAWLRRDAARIAGGRAFQWAITLPGDEIVGSIGMVLDNDDASHLGYWIAVHAWNRGYATEATRAVIAHGFDHLGLRRIEASCFPENAASARVLVKSGMTFERTLPAHVEKDGVLRDVDVYAIDRRNLTTR